MFERSLVKMKTRSHTANTSRSLPSRVMAVLLSAVLFCTGLSLGSLASAEELPVLETDVSQGSSGNLLIGIQGTYIDQISEALDLINSYRLEACQNGYPNPDGSGSLTMSRSSGRTDWSISHGSVPQRLPRQKIMCVPTEKAALPFRHRQGRLLTESVLHGTVRRICCMVSSSGTARRSPI